LPRLALSGEKAEIPRCDLGVVLIRGHGDHGRAIIAASQTSNRMLGLVGRHKKAAGMAGGNIAD
jgi:hypothetical protein